MSREAVEPKKIRPILVAEDNEDDFLLIRDAFEEIKLPVELSWVKNGEELLEYLRRRGPYAGAVTPKLVLLDLKMPKMDGLEALQEIKTDPQLKRFPVVVLTTSGSEDDIRKAYDLGANSFLRKPIGFVLFTEAMQTIYDYWFGIVKLP